MTSAQAILKNHPRPLRERINDIAQLLAACVESTVSCTACADSCLAEEMTAGTQRCIRFCLDCAEICQATSRILARQTRTNFEILRAQLIACHTACRECSLECARHADIHEHCRECSDACHRCAEDCADLLQTLGVD